MRSAEIETKLGINSNTLRKYLSEGIASNEIGYIEKIGHGSRGKRRFYVYIQTLVSLREQDVSSQTHGISLSTPYPWRSWLHEHVHPHDNVPPHANPRKSHPKPK